MIYTVECSFADAHSEAEWNAFYSEQKLPALISVAGFHTSQRFRACTPGCPTYLALHTIDALEVLSSEDYRRKGGGNFARWQPHITDWHRNLYDGLARAPAVAADEHLLVSRVGAMPLATHGLQPQALHAVALERSPAALWLARLPAGVDPATLTLADGVHAYVPMTRQLCAAEATADALRSAASLPGPQQ